MNSLFVWPAFALVAIALGLMAYWFSLRVLRIATTLIALATAAYLTWYGLTHPPNAPGGLSDALTRGANSLIRALFLLQPVPRGHHVAGPGLFGWLTIAVLLVIGYRELEALSQHCHARSLDTSELTRAQKTGPSGDGTDAPADINGALTDMQRHDRLAAELRFWLPAVEVRAPAIIPGGSRSSALASIAEASGINGSGLTGAIIRFFGMLWPRPRRVRVRVWVKGTAVPAKVDRPTKVAVCLDDPGTGASIGTKTLAADSLDNAACAAAGYVAQRIFAADPTAPPWCIGLTDGGDVAAMLLARHERAYPETEENIRKARKTRIESLEKVAWSSQCSGVARYELAHLYDLTGNHVKALELHANNREQYPRFYRGRYRLAMSLEMIASPYPETRISEDERDTFNAVLRILGRWDGAQDDKSGQYSAKDGKLVLSRDLKSYLLGSAQQELHDIGRYLTLWDVVWQSLWHRNERGVLKPYWRWRHRQSYHDGVRLAQLLVAVRQTLNGNKAHLSRPRKVLRIAAAIAGDSRCIAHLLGIRYKAPRWSAPKDPPLPGHQNLPQMVKRWGRKKPPKMDKRLRTRWPWRYSTPSWPAAYNLACVYAAIRADPSQLEARMKEIEGGQALRHPKQIKDLLETLVEKVVTSLEFAIINPDCEMERPSEWIEHDPDFACLRSPGDAFSKFTDFLFIQKQRDYPSNCRRHRIMGIGLRTSILPERSDVL